MYGAVYSKLYAIINVLWTNPIKITETNGIIHALVLNIRF